MARLDGKVALIFGGAHGIGAASALAMAGEGGRVVITDVDEAGAEAKACEARAAGGEAIAIRADIASDHDVGTAVAATLERHGRIDVLLNVAAAFDVDTIGRDSRTDILNLDAAVFDRTIDVNLKGFIRTARAVVPAMLAHGGGVIINTSSTGSLKPEQVRHAYAISKAGVNMLTQAIAVTYGKRNIRCNAVLPGLVMSSTDLPSAYVDMMLRHTLTPEIGIPDDLANVMVFLASEEARYINGELIRVDGGLYTGAPWSADMRSNVADLSFE